MIQLDFWLLKRLFWTVAGAWLLLVMLAGGVDLAAHLRPLLRGDLGWGWYLTRARTLVGGCALPAGVLGAAGFWIQLQTSGEHLGLGSVGYSSRRFLALLTVGGGVWALALHLGGLPWSFHLPSAPVAWPLDGGFLASRRTDLSCTLLVQPSQLVLGGDEEDQVEITAQSARWDGMIWQLQDGVFSDGSTTRDVDQMGWPPPRILCPSPPGVSLVSWLMLGPLALWLGWGLARGAQEKVWAQILGPMAGCGALAVVLAWLQRWNWP